MSSEGDWPTYDDVLAAAERIAPHIHRTPVMTSASIDELVGTRVHLKCEHLQRAGAFKFRGAVNAVFALSDDVAARGVGAHSTGNHAASLALAASMRGIPAHVVMPESAPKTKKDATGRAGAELTICGETMADRVETLSGILAATGATEIHPFDDPYVMAGQGTITLELLDEVPEIGMIVAPVSGGGLLCGTAIAAAAIDPAITVVGAEPADAADAARSLATGRLDVSGNTTSIADGLLAVLCERTFAILQAYEIEVVTVTEEEIIEAMTLVFRRLKQAVEPSGAASLAALMVMARNGVELPSDVAVILSGGNVDLDRLPF